MTPTEALAYLRTYESIKDDYPRFQALGQVEAEQLVTAVRVLDEYLTDKVDSRNVQRDLSDAKKYFFQGDIWVVYLSDGGYSRLILDLFGNKLVWLNRGLSLDKPKQRAEALGLPLG